ncbi:MAG: hypothetical protein KDI74_12720 [Gammaproteobacteria bacterium]|nr:hypothetical protein [Gammaproteobacteria bacterium]
MAEIKQPAPVKPVWPVGREQRRPKRSPQDQSKAGESKRRKAPHDREVEQSGIDEYV